MLSLTIIQDQCKVWTEASSKQSCSTRRSHGRTCRDPLVGSRVCHLFWACYRTPYASLLKLGYIHPKGMSQKLTTLLLLPWPVQTLRYFGRNRRTAVAMFGLVLYCALIVWTRPSSRDLEGWLNYLRKPFYWVLGHVTLSIVQPLPQGWQPWAWWPLGRGPARRKGLWLRHRTWSYRCFAHRTSAGLALRRCPG